MARKKKTVKKAARDESPNVQFVGRRKLSNGKFEDMDAPAFVNTGQQKINLPSSEEQKKGFYLPPKQARAIRAEYPMYYKEPKKKGAAR